LLSIQKQLFVWSVEVAVSEFTYLLITNFNIFGIMKYGQYLHSFYLVIFYKVIDTAWVVYTWVCLFLL